MRRAVEVRVSGVVQGVFFRDSTRRVAREADVVGWVRNEPDGAVRAWLEGESSGVGRVLAWIRAGGPPAAVVQHLDVQDRAPAGHTSFDVVRWRG